MRYTLTFIESGRTERIPERLNDLFFDAIFTATGLFRSKAEMLLEAGPIETTTHIFRRFRWSKVKPILGDLVVIVGALPALLIGVAVAGMAVNN